MRRKVSIPLDRVTDLARAWFACLPIQFVECIDQVAKWTSRKLSQVWDIYSRQGDPPIRAFIMSDLVRRLNQGARERQLLTLSDAGCQDLASTRWRPFILQVAAFGRHR